MPKTLLLADDSVTIQRVIELTFANEDIRVVAVSDGKRAVQWMDSEWPDIVLVDVEVPELDGYGVASYVKKSPRLKNVPVLLLAGAFEPVDEKRAASIGCEGVLVKPFEPQQLVSRVTELLTPPPAKSGGRKSAGAAAPADAPETATVTPFPTQASRGDEGPFRVTHGSPFDAGGAPESLEPPARPVWETGGSTPLGNAPAARSAEAPAPKVSLVNAFSALLAAEQSTTPAPAAAAAPAAISDASVEDAVRRVLARMTDDLVRRIVVETAERLIKEEIQKIKDNPE
ncbi:MAG TPA: response regulator [Vicinamibacterales bacterium]|nr:response regulator [Vicinamibacterales bacterium]